jgi:hypothetical protein
VHVNGKLPVKVGGIEGVCYQSAVLGIDGVGVDRRQTALLCQSGDKPGIPPKCRFRTEQQRVGSVMPQFGEAALDLWRRGIAD